MISRLARGLAVSALAVTGLCLSSCKSSVPQPPQQSSVGTRVDVVKASKSNKGQRVDVRVKIWNDHDARISFALGDVGLEAAGRRCTPNPSLTKIQNPGVQQGSYQQFDWAFEVGEPVGPGTYTITIANVQKGGAPLGESIAFKINLGA